MKKIKLKNVIKIFGFIILVVALLLTAFICILYSRPQVSVLAYHNIATAEEKAKFPKEKYWTIDVKEFERELKYLKDAGYTTLSMDEFYEWKIGKREVPFKSVVITFDDGFESNYKYAYPLLKKYGMKGTTFVIGSMVKDRDSTWRGNLYDYLTLDQIKNYKKEYPNIDICSHSFWLHKGKAVFKKSEKEIEEDFDKFSKLTETKYMAYPFGDYNDKIKKVLKKKGYNLAFTFGDEGSGKMEFRKALRSDDNYAIPRFDMSRGIPFYKFVIRLLLPY